MFKICVGLGLAWLAWLGSAWLGLVCLAWRLGKSGQASGLLCLAWLGFGGLAWLGLAWLVGLAGAGLAGLGWGRAWLGYNSLLRGLRAPQAKKRGARDAGRGTRGRGTREAGRGAAGTSSLRR